jgi:hypothetical protein
MGRLVRLFGSPFSCIVAFGTANRIKIFDFKKSKSSILLPNEKIQLLRARIKLLKAQLSKIFNFRKSSQIKNLAIEQLLIILSPKSGSSKIISNCTTFWFAVPKVTIQLNCEPNKNLRFLFEQNRRFCATFFFVSFSWGA